MTQQMQVNHGVTSKSSDEINVFVYLNLLKKYKKMIIGIVILASVFAIVVSLFLPKYYRAASIIIPISSKGSGGSSLVSQFGGLASLAGVNLGGGAGDSDKIVAILRSRSLAENVINRENLMPTLLGTELRGEKQLEPDSQKERLAMEMAVIALRKAVTINDDKKSKTIQITGVFQDPETSARAVNAYVDGLQMFINTNAFTMAKRNRIFIEDQLDQNKKELLEAGREINEFYKENRVSGADAKMDVPLNLPTTDNQMHDSKSSLPVASLASDIASYDHQGESSNEKQSDKQVRDLEGLLNQKMDVEKKIEEARVVRNIPQQVYLTYLMLRRELLVKVNALLTTQYEMSKIEESKEDLAFQTIDKAVPPVKRFKPERTKICFITFMTSIIGAVFLAFLREYINRMKQIASDQ